jgi:transposase-like protein
MVVESGRRPVAQVARELGINSGTLGNWVATCWKAHPVDEEPLAVSERARLRELERKPAAADAGGVPEKQPQIQLMVSSSTIMALPCTATRFTMVASRITRGIFLGGGHQSCHQAVLCRSSGCTVADRTRTAERRRC